MRPNACRAACLVLLALILPLAGCQTASPKQTKQQAEQHWNQMRAGVKLQLARQHADRQLYEETLADATESLALDSTQPDAYALATKAHLELGRLTSAEQVLEASRRLGVASSELSYLAGVIAEQRGEIETALGSFREARRTNGANVDYLIAETECLVSLDRAEEALALLEASFNSFDDDATIAAAAGRVAALLGDNDRAVIFYRTAFTHQPDSRSVRRELGLLLAQCGRCEEALPVLGAIADRSDGETPGSVYRTLAGCHLLADNPVAAANVLSNYLTLRPDDAAGQLLFAQSAIATRDHLGAIRSLYLAETHGAPRSRVLFLRGVTAWRQGNMTEAANLLEQVLSIDPADADASCLLGEVHAALGNDQSAVEAFSRALHLSPSNPWAKERLMAISK